MATIVLTGGGSAGHCIPNLALLPYLKNDFQNIIYIGSKNGIEKDIVLKAGLEYHPITCCKLKRNLSFDNLLIPFNLAKGINEAKLLLKEIKPNVVFSKGGFVSLPVVYASRKLNIPVISHESDLTMGLANKLSAKYCQKILTSFPETAKTLKNGEFTGAPIRREIFITDKNKAFSFFDFKDKKPILLITGGSQGATSINEVVWQSLNELLNNFNVIHVCGKNNLNKKINKDGYFQTEYLSNMELALNVASVCISRAGSNTLFELIALKIPSVLIPLPKGNSRGDQVLNAEYFLKKGLFTLLPQHLLTPESLIYNVNATYKNSQIAKKNFEKFSFIDGSRKISRIIADSMR